MDRIYLSNIQVFVFGDFAGKQSESFPKNFN